MIGSVSEACFFAALFLIGSTALAQRLIERIAGESAFNLGTFLLWGLVVASLIVTGAGGLIYTVAGVATSNERRLAMAKKAANLELLSPSPKGLPAVPSAANLTNSPGVKLDYRLPVMETAAWHLPATAAFCLAWNGVLCVISVLLWHQFRHGSVDWKLAALWIPLAMVGGTSIYHLLRRMMMATAIGPTSLEISDHPLTPGIPYQLCLGQTGNLRMQSIELLLICEEEATYRQGTDMRIERRPVFEQPVFRREDFEVPAGTTYQQSCELKLPRDAMHSFQAEHNAIHWKLIVRGITTRWPVFERAFPLVVHPLLATNTSNSKI